MPPDTAGCLQEGPQLRPGDNPLLVMVLITDIFNLAFGENEPLLSTQSVGMTALSWSSPLLSL